ncbi:major facilitator superfamily domain-containing protein [Massariosphaeria phaeospora]|uniref:Major facilitator superfamily domain-containing protein n=1 Tax=Massariosphaeria phaeospora TaxID=100035 RepID=A0A7C8M6M4_9PLEO|nr:major facilitator superfamily domain-containing protein [Massariosphaeria phaeospora]
MDTQPSSRQTMEVKSLGDNTSSSHAHTSPSESSHQDTSAEAVDETQYFTGHRLHIITIWLLLPIFIVQMDSTITSTSILAITDDLGGYDKSSWVFTSYMLTYCGFQMISAKLSDILTRRTTLAISLLIFTVFSAACAASQTLMQLIMFRCVQGIGAAGVYALRMWPTYMGLMSGVIALALVVGPLIGGAIAQHGQWRWIFLLNVPACSIAIIGLLISLPKTLWNEPSARNRVSIFSTLSLRRIDVLGSTLLLGACLLVSTGIQQAALGYAWTSVFVLPLLLLVLPFLAAFFAWERHITTFRTYPEPVFPWRFCQSRISTGMILNAYFSGTVLMICLVQIPQRFIAVNNLSAFAAAVRLLAFGGCVPGGSTLSAVLMGRLQMPPCVVIVLGAVLQLVGAVLLARIPTGSAVYVPQFGYHVLVGLGVGFVTGALILLVPFAMHKRDLAVGSASMAQFRILGGLIGISIATSLSTPYLRTHLSAILPPDLALAVLHRTENLRLLQSPAVRETVRGVFGEAFNLQVTLAVGFVVAQFLATGLMWTMRRVDA